MMQPFNFDQWIKDNKDKLKPPVANKNISLQGLYRNGRSRSNAKKIIIIMKLKSFFIKLKVTYS